MLQLHEGAPQSSPVRETSRLDGRVTDGEAHDVVLCAGMYRGTPAILAVTDCRIFFAWVPSGETKMRDIPIRQLLAVEEDVRGRFSDLTVLASHTTITLTDVPRVRAWEFCQRARHAILADGSRKRARGMAAARKPRRRYERRPYGPNQPEAR